MISRRVLKAIIKKQDEQGVMARKVSVLCSILRKTLISWRSLWRGSLLQNKISVVSCYKRQKLTQSHLSAVERCCYITLVRIIQSVTVLCAITVFIQRRRLSTEATSYYSPSSETLKENFRQEYVIDFVRGRATDDQKDHKHDELDEFGEGEE